MSKTIKLMMNHVHKEQGDVVPCRVAGRKISVEGQQVKLFLLGRSHVSFKGNERFLSASRR